MLEGPDPHVAGRRLRRDRPLIRACGSRSLLNGLNLAGPGSQGPTLGACDPRQSPPAEPAARARGRGAPDRHESDSSGLHRPRTEHLPWRPVQPVGSSPILAGAADAGRPPPAPRPPPRTPPPGRSSKSSAAPRPAPPLTGTVAASASRLRSAGAERRGQGPRVAAVGSSRVPAPRRPPRPAGATLGPAELDALLVTRAGQRPLPDRLHRLQRRAAGHPDRDAVLATDGRYVTQAGTQSADLELVVDRAVRAGPGRPGGASTACGRLGLRGARRDRSSCTSCARRPARRRGWRWFRWTRRWRRCGPSRTTPSSPCSRQACAISDQALRELFGHGRRRAHRARGRPRARAPDARARRRRRRLRHHRRGRAEQRDPAPPAHRPAARARRPAQDRLRRAVRRLPRRHDPDRRRGRASRPTGSARSTTWSPRRSGPAGTRWPPGASVRDVDAAARDGDRATPATASSSRTGSATGWAWRSTRPRCSGPRRPVDSSDRTPVTVEPGVYLPGRGGVRIEDTLVVATTARRELLTTTTEGAARRSASERTRTARHVRPAGDTPPWRRRTT